MIQSFREWLEESEKENNSSTVKPKTKKELQNIIQNTIDKEGPNCDLNFIDTSEITDMSRLFLRSGFNGDISNWNVSKVKNMSQMFELSSFTGDISKWNVSNVEDMFGMFTASKIKCDFSNWNVSKVKNMSRMFFSFKGEIIGDISNWNVSKVSCIDEMFYNAGFYTFKYGENGEKFKKLSAKSLADYIVDTTECKTDKKFRYYYNKFQYEYLKSRGLPIKKDNSYLFDCDGGQIYDVKTSENIKGATLGLTKSKLSKILDKHFKLKPIE